MQLPTTTSRWNQKTTQFKGNHNPESKHAEKRKQQGIYREGDGRVLKPNKAEHSTHLGK